MKNVDTTLQEHTSSACIDNEQQKDNLTDTSIYLQPAFTENNIAVLLCANDKYAPYLSVVVQSILENSSVENNYDIIVFTRDITQENQKIIQQQLEKNANFSIRFYDVTLQMQDYTELHVGVDGRITLETYYRLLAPYILNKYKKILYLDCDVIVKKDIAKLYSIDLETENYLLAACHDSYITICYQVNYENIATDNGINFSANFNPNNYFNAGVILFNLEAFRLEFTFQTMFDIAKSKKWMYHDQDVLNQLALNRTKFLDMRWNIITDWVDRLYNQKMIRKMNEYSMKLVDDYANLKQDSYIIHYAAFSEKKPWVNSTREFGEIWWGYAVHTPYAKILKENLEHAEKERKKFKNRFKRFMKKMLMPFVNLFYPKGSERREKLREKYYKKKK